MNIIKKLTVLSLASVVGLTACKKSYLDRKPTDEAATVDVFETTAGARAAVNGIIRSMYTFTSGNQHNCFGQPSIHMMYDLMGEDFIDNGYGHFNPEYSYAAARTAATDQTPGYSWFYYYKIINNANMIIVNVPKSKGTQEERDEIMAQALFFRAYAYYNLANSFAYSYKMNGTLNIPGTSNVPAGYSGNILNSPCVPLYTAPTQVAKPRATVKEVYDQIGADLTQSIALFDASGIIRTDKSQANGNVARGLAARVALVKQDWAAAAEFAHDAREGYSYMGQGDALAGFNDINNNEWIWGLGINSEQTDGPPSFISFMDRQAQGYALIHSQMVVLNDIRSNRVPETDVRKNWWLTRAQVTPGSGDPRYIGIYRQFEQLKFRQKIKGSTAADYPLMRASEMALIEAEALAQQGMLAQSGTVLEEWAKTRDPDFVATTSSKNVLVHQIWWQRRIELWGEGFRWFDIKRKNAPMAGVSLTTDEVGLKRTGNSGPAAQVRDIAEPLDPRFVLRIPGGETAQNPGLLQNP